MLKNGNHLLSSPYSICNLCPRVLVLSARIFYPFSVAVSTNLTRQHGNQHACDSERAECACTVSTSGRHEKITERRATLVKVWLVRVLLPAKRLSSTRRILARKRIPPRYRRLRRFSGDFTINPWRREWRCPRHRFGEGRFFLKEAAVIGEIFFSECASRAARAKISLIDGRRDFID